MTYTQQAAANWADRQLKKVPASPEKDARLKELAAERLAVLLEQQKRANERRKARGYKQSPYKPRIAAGIETSGPTRPTTSFSSHHSYWE